MIINSGLVTVIKGQKFFVIHDEHSVTSNIRRGAVAFFHGDVLHHDIEGSELTTQLVPFHISTEDPYNNKKNVIEISSEFEAFINTPETIKICCGHVELHNEILYYEKNGDKIYLFLKTPLSSVENPLYDSGALIVNKRKVILSSTYLGDSLFNAPYLIAQDFTKNLNLPLMDVTNPVSSPLASMYNRNIKLLDQYISALKDDFDKKLKAKENDKSVLTINPANYWSLHHNEIKDEEITLDLNTTNDLHISKIATQTKSGFVECALLINDSIVDETIIMSNKEKYVKEYNFYIPKGSKVDVRLINVVDGSGFSLKVEYKECNL